MKIENVTEHHIHGGTLRYIIKKGFFDFYRQGLILNDIQQNIISCKEKLKEMIRDIRRKGKRVVGVSAPAKGNTLLNYCEIDLDYITEKSPLKIGKFSPGRHIQIVPDSRLIEDQPEYALLLAWNFQKQIIDSLPEYKGRWIVPIPEPHIVSKDSWHKVDGL